MAARVVCTRRTSKFVEDLPAMPDSTSTSTSTTTTTEANDQRPPRSAPISIPKNNYINPRARIHWFEDIFARRRLAALNTHVNRTTNTTTNTNTTNDPFRLTKPTLPLPISPSTLNPLLDPYPASAPTTYSPPVCALTDHYNGWKPVVYGGGCYTAVWIRMPIEPAQIEISPAQLKLAALAKAHDAARWEIMLERERRKRFGCWEQGEEADGFVATAPAITMDEISNRLMKMRLATQEFGEEIDGDHWCV